MAGYLMDDCGREATDLFLFNSDSCVQSILRAFADLEMLAEPLARMAEES